MPKQAENLELSAAYREYEREVRIRNYRVACVLAFIFMPAGALLDRMVLSTTFPDKLLPFLGYRVLCSLLLLFIWWLVRRPIGPKTLWILGQVLPALPSFFISLMIRETEGAASPYYAGINLVLLGAALVLRWSLLDSILVVLTAMGMYLAACFSVGNPFAADHTVGIFFNNCYFIFVTGVFLIIGNLFYNRIRFREFALRFELDKNRKALEESNSKLLEMDQIKGRFFANISHELRTPLTLLLAPLETLLQKPGLEEPVKALLATMHSNSMRLLKLINDLLALVRLESGRMEVKPEPLDLAEFIKGLASAARQVAEDKRLRLETVVASNIGSVMADRDKLEKILLNLVFNALKFTPAGGKVELRAERALDQLILTVSDTGMGISQKNLPHIFDRFWQADGSSRRKYQGVGIGLALVKELVEIQKGTVQVESEEGKGTTFTIRLAYVEALPVQKPAPPPGEDTVVESGGTVSSEEWLANLYRRAELFPAMTPVQESVRPIEISRNGKHKTILIADDEPDMLRYLKSQLSEEYHVLEAVDGQQAVEKVSQFLPDLVLLDMMMPEKDGLQACRELREHTPTQSIPIVLLTARADEDTKLAALSAGASDFLTKPFSRIELHVRIKNLIESHEYQRKVSKQNLALENTIEQLKETETHLVQSEKVASLGVMSAGIIHDINNPLNYANMGLQALKKKATQIPVEQREDYEEVLKDVEDGINRVKDLVSDLRVFAHPETESRDCLPVEEAVSVALRLLSNRWKNKIRVEPKIPEGQVIWANRNMLTHVLVNLLQNAFDALEAKTFAPGEAPTVQIEGRLEKNRSILTIRDNGPGIAEKNLSKIFDPFFTTKDVGKGMGLGLSICYRIVHGCDGQIAVRTEPGKFCEFSLEFPAKQ